MKINKVFLIAFCLLFAIFAGCSGDGVKRGLCCSCSSEENLVASCPFCLAEICESCWLDIEYERSRENNSWYEEGLNEGYNEGYERAMAELQAAED